MHIQSKIVFTLMRIKQSLYNHSSISWLLLGNSKTFIDLHKDIKVAPLEIKNFTKYYLSI